MGFNVVRDIIVYAVGDVLIYVVMDVIIDFIRNVIIYVVRDVITYDLVQPVLESFRLTRSMLLLLLRSA